ncbi:uncharacterized protein LOC112144024 [Oryzias melastigma]|uniref:uncharacterized protein LOC112144024 n=1 Tax=Oryzias melastigma TaxID=30732 RepID=UPI000CF7B6E1|nr:uncharacterized protein LOC112144024 [Oryzias melastigma]
MDTSDALSTMKKFLITQVVPPRASAVQKVVARMQTFAQRTCQLFCLPLQPLPCGNISCCSAQTHQLEPGVKKQDHSQSVQSVPPTILIVNISNSTLIDCVIGDSCPSAAAERQPLMQEAELQKHAQLKCSCRQKEQVETQSLPPPPPPPPPACASASPQEQLNISIESSHLNCVIIGDNNHMHIETSPASD